MSSERRKFRCYLTQAFQNPLEKTSWSLEMAEAKLADEFCGVQALTAALLLPSIRLPGRSGSFQSWPASGRACLVGHQSEAEAEVSADSSRMDGRW